MTVIMLSRDGMGHAAPALQQKLLGVYLTLLNEHSLFPGAICFVTDGVKLVVEGSPVLDALRQLEAHGVPLIICATCLNYFGLADKVQVGTVGGMTDILEAQMRASKVISL